MAFTTDERVWNEFLAEWPLERLRTMTLDEYTKSGDKNCFTYWIEARLDGYGSVWGGSAFKFAIYSRSERTPKQGDSALAYSEDHGWYRRFGDTPEEAFAAVREEVVSVAEYAQEGKLQNIDNSTLGPAYRWKIAFHYQDRSAPNPFPCIFQTKPLLHFTGRSSNDNSTPLSQLYRETADGRNKDESLLAFSQRVWRSWVLSTPLRISLKEGAVHNGYLPINLSIAPFPESIRGGNTDKEAGESVRFRTDTGWEFFSDVRAPGTENGRIRSRFGQYYRERNVQPGDVIEIRPDDDGGFLITHHPKSGRVQPVLQAESHQPSPAAGTFDQPAIMPTNKILFGPPGTGKTYSSINLALELLDPAFLRDNAEDRPALKDRFDALFNSGHIRFVTFHQSFSYEDFVEGIRATVDEQSKALSYNVEDGVFKQICEAARSRTVAETNTSPEVEGRKIWKFSLGDAGSEGHIYDECMSNGYALMGFGADLDFTGVQSREDIAQRLREAGENVGINDYGVTALNMLVRQMNVGDLVIVSEGNFKFRAIGEVTGGYRHLERDGADSYSQCRPIRWLRQYAPARPYEELMENRFSQMTLYEPSRGSVKMQRLAALLAHPGADDLQTQGRVLIIDEINRGNVSRIFGELITLIEPSKREGAAEALAVTLPYSKKRFSVPSNVHLIGTMNTADRSLAGLDIALRRRFEFVEMEPAPESLKDILVDDNIDLVAMLRVMNQRIEVLLGRDYMLGHAYFLTLKEDPNIEALADVFRNKVIPLLQEYFFEEWQKIAWVLNDHRKEDTRLRFIREPATGMEELFGSGVDLPETSRLWRIQNAAFYEPDAYIGIYASQQRLL